MTKLNRPETPATDSADASLQQRIIHEEPRNLFVLVLHSVFLRIGWIFKTESVIVPAFLDAISGSGWIRGWLPILNRVGQSIPPLIFAPTLRDQRVKKWSLLATTGMMAVLFLILASYLAVNSAPYPNWLPYGFLVLYLLFFSATGLNQLVFGVIQGKLIRPHRRGRLMALSGIIGSIGAIACAWTLLQSWCNRADGGFSLIFGFTGGGFVVAAATVWLVREPADATASRSPSVNHFGNAWRVLKADKHLRRLSLVAMMFVTAHVLLPHYQRLGRNHFAGEDTPFMVWVVAQNAGAGMLSVLAGWIADRFGNRLAIRIMVAGAAISPLVALLQTRGGMGSMNNYWVTFFVLGALPTTFKTLSNYALELTERKNHAQYISTLKLCMTIPLLGSPLIGWLTEPTQLGFTVVFAFTSAITWVGAVMTFWMIEPRRHPELLQAQKTRNEL